jgi:hypothetical protein
VAYVFPLETFFFPSIWIKALTATAVLCLPVFFAGIVFIRSFARENFRSEPSRPWRRMLTRCSRSSTSPPRDFERAMTIVVVRERNQLYRVKSIFIAISEHAKLTPFNIYLGLQDDL